VRPRAGLAALVLTGLLLSPSPGAAADGDLTDLVGAYLKAGAEQAPGVVAARAYVEPTRPSAAATPQPDVSVVLLPYSAALEAELDAVKAGVRDSVDAYIRAVTRIEAARVNYERALLAAGGGALVRADHRRQGGARVGRARGRVATAGLAGRGAHAKHSGCATPALSACAVQRDLFPGHVLAEAGGVKPAGRWRSQ
jgi:hypothetical protein